ncbi:MAG: hypothetical protein KI786_03105, partial [Mameliella sp.]|nr:hypothetical protein [Phaeodactylibacter sp.]
MLQTYTKLDFRHFAKKKRENKLQIRVKYSLTFGAPKVKLVVGQKQNAQLSEAFAPISFKTRPLVGFERHWNKTSC